MATFKTLQAGSASHLRMTSQLAGAISGGLTVASVIVRMVHDMVRDAIADIIGKLTSKAIITAVSLGTASGWAITSLSADVTAWATRLSKEVADVVTSAKNLKKLLDKAETLFRRVGKKWESLKASRAEKKAAKKKATRPTPPRGLPLPAPFHLARMEEELHHPIKARRRIARTRDVMALPSPLRKRMGVRLAQKDLSQTCRAYGGALPTTFSISFLTTGLLTPHEKSLMGLGLGIPTVTASKLFTNQESPGPKIHYTQAHTSECQRVEKHIESHWKEIQRYDRSHHCRSAVHGNRG